MGGDTSVAGDGSADDNGVADGDGRMCAVHVGDDFDDTEFEGVDLADVDNVELEEGVISCKRCLGHGLCDLKSKFPIIMYT